jgi:hypothetical protein
MSLKVTKVHIKISKSSFCTLYYLFNAQSFKNFLRMSTLWRHKFLIKLSMTLKVIQVHIRPHFSTFVYGPILMKICINANIMKTELLHKIIYDLKCTFMLWRSFRFFYFKTLWPKYNFDLRSYGQLLSLVFFVKYYLCKTHSAIF